MSQFKMEVAPSHLYLSIRGIQYSFHEAIADLVDNSVDAYASTIWIKADKNEVIIADNGDGMKTEDLKTAITPWKAGSKSGKDRRGKRGKYGIGLKSASYSIGTVLDIHTKHKDSKFEHIHLDQKSIAKIDDPEHEFVTENSMTSLFKNYCKDGHGTILRITDVNQRKVTSQGIQSLRNLLGLTFFQLIENGDLEIFVNNEKVKSLDPLLRGLKKNKDKNRYFLFDRETIEVEYEGIKAVFRIQGAYIGRGSYWTDEDRTSYRYFLKRNPSEDDSTKLGLIKLNDQGIYTLRNGRLITQGGWWGITSENSLLHHNGPARIILEFDETGDNFVGLDSTKTALKIEEHLKDALSNYVINIRRRTEELFREEGKDILAERLKKEASKKVNKLSLRKDSAKASYKIDERRKRANPEYDEAQRKIEVSVAEDAKKSTDFVEVKEKLPYNFLWDYQNNKENETLLLLNSQHLGYGALFLEQDINILKDNILHLLYTIAMYEASIKDLHSEFSPEKLDEVVKLFETFRKWVSKHYTEF